MTNQIMPIQSMNFFTLFCFLKIGKLKSVTLLQAFYQFINTEDLFKLRILYPSISEIDSKRYDHILHFLEKNSVLKKPQLTFLINTTLEAPGMMNINSKYNIPIIILQKLPTGILVDNKYIEIVLFLKTGCITFAAVPEHMLSSSFAWCINRMSSITVCITGRQNILKTVFLTVGLTYLHYASKSWTFIISLQD